MHIRSFGFVAALIAAAPVGAADTAGAQRAAPGGPPALRQLRVVDSLASRHAADRGLATLAPLLASDAYYLAPGLPILRGRSAVVDALRGEADDGGPPRRIGWRTAGSGISTDGTLGFTYGYTESNDSSDQQAAGKYIAVWRKEDGWRLLALVLSTPVAGEHAGSAVAARAAARVASGVPERAGEARRAVLATDSAFARRAASAGIATAFATYAAPDAAILPSGARIINGPDSIGAAYGKMPEGARLEWAPVDAEAAASGDLAFTVGEAVFSTPDRASSGARRSYSKYLTIWRRQPDGSWRYVVDGGNERPQTRAPAP